MNSGQITASLRAHCECATLMMGIVSVVGSLLNWNSMCDPTGKTDFHSCSVFVRRQEIFEGFCAAPITSLVIHRACAELH